VSEHGGPGAQQFAVPVSRQPDGFAVAGNLRADGATAKLRDREAAGRERSRPFSAMRKILNSPTPGGSPARGRVEVKYIWRPSSVAANSETGRTEAARGAEDQQGAHLPRSYHPCRRPAAQYSYSELR